GLGVDEHAEPGPDDGLVIGDHHADGHATRPTCAWPALAWSGSGRKAVTWNPPPATGPASRLPPNAAARSFMPTKPCRAPPGGPPPPAGRPPAPPFPRWLSPVTSPPSRPACTRTVARAPGACLTTLVSASWTMRYTVSEAAGGSAATSPVTASDTGIPAARTV